MFDFLWYVHTGGYQWVELPESSLLSPEEELGPCWYLVPALGDKPELSPARRYLPLQKETGLFRTFANTAPTREGICAFANRYGQLTVPGPEETSPSSDTDASAKQEGLLEKKIDFTVMLPWPPEPGRRIPCRGERFEALTWELLLLRQVVFLSDMTRKNNLEGLARHLRWYGPDRVFYRSTPGMPTKEPTELFPRRRLQWDAPEPPHLDIDEWIAAPWFHKELLEGLKVGDLLKPALCFIQRVVNARLKKLMSPSLLWDPELKELHLRFVPRTLRGALWLQCAQAISGNKDYRQCPESQCKKWFELTPHIARSDKQFCSNACRTRAYRKRQRLAR